MFRMEMIHSSSPNYPALLWFVQIGDYTAVIFINLLANLDSETVLIMLNFLVYGLIVL